MTIASIQNPIIDARFTDRSPAVGNAKSKTGRGKVFSRPDRQFNISKHSCLQVVWPASSNFGKNSGLSAARKDRRAYTCTATASDSATVQDRTQQELVDFLQWIASNGSKGKGLSMDSAKYDGERCLVATSAVPAGKPLLAFPWTLALSDDPNLLAGPPLYPGAHWGVVLAVRLVQEYMRGQESKWHEYIKILPMEVPALWWLASQDPEDTLGRGAEALEEVQYGPIVKQARAMAVDVVEAYKRLVETTSGSQEDSALRGASLERFLWAVSMVHSRSMAFEDVQQSGETSVRHVMMPLADMLNHSGDQYTDSSLAPLPKPDVEVFPPEPVAPPSLGKVVGEEGQETHNIEWLSDASPDALYFVATKELAAGEEALLSYGDRSNDHFLLYYGFVPQRNPHDDFVLFDGLEDVFDWVATTVGTGDSEQQWQARKEAAKLAVQQTERAAAAAGDAALVASEPRLKILSGLRIDARLLSALCVLNLPIRSEEDPALSSNQNAIRDEDITEAYKLVRARCQEMLDSFATTLEDDLRLLSTDTAPGREEQRAFWGGVWEQVTDLDVASLMRKGYMPQILPGSGAGGEDKAGTDLNDIQRLAAEYRAHKKLLLTDNVRLLTQKIEER